MEFPPAAAPDWPSFDLNVSFALLCLAFSGLQVRPPDAEGSRLSQTGSRRLQLRFHLIEKNLSRRCSNLICVRLRALKACRASVPGTFRDVQISTRRSCVSTLTDQRPAFPWCEEASETRIRPNHAQPLNSTGTRPVQQMAKEQPEPTMG